MATCATDTSSMERAARAAGEARVAAQIVERVRLHPCQPPHILASPSSEKHLLGTDDQRNKRLQVPVLPCL